MCEEVGLELGEEIVMIKIRREIIFLEKVLYKREREVNMMNKEVVLKMEKIKFWELGL